jgi:DMSO/TMAO reductase YedYZ molybdopterin-dependent catalytic subunit
MSEPKRSRLSATRRFFQRAFGKDPQLTVEQQIRRRTLISFSIFGLLGAAAWKSWFVLKDQPHDHGGIQATLRKGLDADRDVFQHTLSPNHLAPIYPKSAAVANVRRNGNAGMDTNNFDAATWKLQVTTANNQPLSIGIDELRQLPKTEFAFEFKCIEGWSQISHWGGVRFIDFVQHYGLTKEAAQAYVGFSTPDNQYYVGIDTPSAVHPQTLLCYEMNGQPLPIAHGGPLRLIIPIKYGVKNLKRIGKMYFSEERPPDYWYERGYDYYCGL